jgi:alginate O-acetyltransferase complex protein AlgI
VDYVAGQRIAASEQPSVRKHWLVFALTINLVILGFFKYYGFFAASVNQGLHAMGMEVAAPVLQIVLPIGISFYTFNSMSYTIDVYRRVVHQARTVLHYSAFVALFPHLVAGPIVRYADIEDQLNNLKSKLPASEAAIGIFFFVCGMAKKVLIADRLAGPVDLFFADSAGQGAIATWLAVLGYTFQLYFDFSGYSDMAVGLAHLLGIQFPRNFRMPYQAEDIADFWRRWHISLSTWLRDYLFIPLGGSRLGLGRTAWNLTITMFLGGLWHGANWTFVVWGLYHGVLLALNHFAKQRDWLPASVAQRRAVTFLAVMVGWVFFRSTSLGQAGQIFGAMLGANGLGTVPADLVFLGWLLMAAAIAHLGSDTWEVRWQPRLSYAFAASLILTLCILLLDKESPFLYFQF